MFSSLSSRIAARAPRLGPAVRRYSVAVAEAPARSVFFAGAAAGAAATAAVIYTHRGGFSVSTAEVPEGFYLERRVGDLEISNATRTSSAFVFIKPHAVTPEVKKLAREFLAEKGISVVSEGEIPAERIDKQFLIDKHYGAIAAKAVKQKPAELTVQPAAQEAFQKKFGLAWSDAMGGGKVFNAMDAAAKLGISTEELGAKFGKSEKLKFGGGFYCGKIDDIFVINGFYMDMRSKFTKPGTCIYYFEAEWNTASLPWGDFRGKVLGGTDPAKADPTSLRHLIFKDWEKLGLKAQPNTGDNGMHASASPFEALSERSNWLGMPLESDPYGRAMLSSGVPFHHMKAWTDDPPVNFEGKKQSIFDLLEDLDARDCLKKSVAVSNVN